MVHRWFAVCLVVFVAGSAVAARHRAVTPPAAPKSSETLIQNALQNGAIDSETALLYSVYAVFGDDRLPAVYRGDDSNVFDSLVMFEVRQRFAALSPQAQSVLTPYLIPPFYTNSWWALRHRANKDGLPIHGLAFNCGVVDTDDWEYVDAQKANVRVWAQKANHEYLRASKLAAEIDTTIWPKLVSLLGKEALGDNGSGDCKGGNGRIDVALIDGTESVTMSYFDLFSDPPLPAYVQVARSARDGDFAVTAHELMHAFQFSYRKMDRWMMEAYGQWAQDYVYRDPPGNTGLEQRAAYFYTSKPNASLLLHDGEHDYGAYLFPFFVERSGKDTAFVKHTYEAVTGGPSIAAIDAALQGAGGLDKVWKDFAVAAYNREPFDSFMQWDKLSASTVGSSGWVEAKGDLGGSPQGEVVLDEVKTTEKLSIRYDYFSFTDSNSRSVTFWNGFSRKLSKGTFSLGPLSGTTYVSDARGDSVKKGLGVQALLKIGGKWTREDWTDRPYVSLCRDKTAERLEELILIFTNSDYERLAPSYTVDGLDSRLVLSNVGCYQYRGTMEAKVSDSLASTDSTADVVWKRTSAGGLGDVPYALAFYGEGQVQWSTSGPGNNGCAISGSGGGALGPFDILSNSLLLVHGLPSGDNNRSYIGTGASGDVGKAHDCNASFDAVAVWFAAPPPQPPQIPIFKIATDGTIDGTFVDPGGHVQAKWHLTPERE